MLLEHYKSVTEDNVTRMYGIALQHKTPDRD